MVMLLLPFLAMAQSEEKEPELDSDRPSITQSPKVVPQGRVQM